MEVLLLEDVKVFLHALEENTFAKALRMIELLEEFGVHLRMPHSKPLHRNLYELRVRGPQEVRMLYAFRDREVIIVHAFFKKSQRIAQRDLDYGRKMLNKLDEI